MFVPTQTLEESSTFELLRRLPKLEVRVLSCADNTCELLLELERCFDISTAESEKESNCLRLCMWAQNMILTTGKGRHMTGLKSIFGKCLPNEPSGL